MARSKSILTEARQIERAVTLINLGARLQVLESETDLSYERLLRLYKEVAGKSPSKGQLPFSTDWFMTWQPNIHASLFLNIHEYLNKAAALDEIDSIIKAYKLYTEQMSSQNLEPLLSVTRAWRLVKFVDNGMLTMTACSKCKGHFITHPHEIARHYVCGLCNPPARAGKGKLQGSLTNTVAKPVDADVDLDVAEDELYANVRGDDELHTILRAEAEAAADLVPVSLLAAKRSSKARTSAA
jgi:flagellar transcriptional activator FlhC